MSNLFFDGWNHLANDVGDAGVWGFVQNVHAGVLVHAVNERVAEAVLAWELSGGVIP